MADTALLIDPISREYDLVEMDGKSEEWRERLIDLDTLYGILGLSNPETVHSQSFHER